MSIQLQCKDLGVPDCHVGFRGKSPTEVAERCVLHLQAAHDLNMPDTDEIAAGNLDEIDDERTRLVARRLFAALYRNA